MQQINIRLYTHFGEMYTFDIQVPKNRNPDKFITKWISNNLKNINHWERTNHERKTA